MEKGKHPTASADQEKQVAFYSATVQAWIDTKMERDRTLVGLSTGGIGLLVTFLTTLHITIPAPLLWFGLGLGGFSASLVGALWIFSANAHHIEQVNKGHVAPSKLLSFLDVAMLLGFVLGVAATIAIGVLAATHGGVAACQR